MTTSKPSAPLQYLYLTTTGRVTGQPREIEIWFVEYESKYYLLAEHFYEAQWVKNILRDPRIEVRINSRTYKATARVLDKEIDAKLWKQAQALGREKYGWGDGMPVEITLGQPL